MRTFITKVMLRVMILVACLSPAPALAGGYHSNYSNGYHEDGYTYRDGYWYNAGGDQFTREYKEWQERVWDPYYCRYVHKTYYKWVYHRAAAPLIRKEGWKQEGVKLLRDIEDNTAYRQFVEAVGYPYSTGGGYSASQQLKLYGATGNTLYSQYAAAPEFLNRSDLMVLFQQAFRLQDRQQAYTAQGQDGLRQSLQLTAEQAGKLAEAQMLSEFLRSRQPRAEIKTEIRGPAPQEMPRVDGPLPLVEPLTMARRIEIAQKHLVTKVAADKHMPPGKALSDDELAAFLAGDFDGVEKVHNCSACHAKKGVGLRLK